MVNYEERKNTHRCTYCGAQLPDGYLGCKCQTCQDKVNQRQNARYQERKAAGLCVQCGTRPAVIGRVKCEQCLNREIFNRHKRAFAGIAFGLMILAASANNTHAAEIDIRSDAVEILEGPESAVEVLPELEPLGEYTITYYCACRKCNGKWGAVAGFGKPLKWGTVAVDKKVLPMHTRLVIDGFDMVFEARDTGSGVKGKHIDVFVPVSHAEALRMGQGEKKQVWRVIE